MKKAALLIIPVIFLFNTCALEIANVIGPGGGWVFYDKGNYDHGWRYIECSSADFGEIKNDGNKAIVQAKKICEDHSDDRFRFPWELPDEAQLKKMLECFSYGLTNFSPDVYYLSLNIQEKDKYENVDLDDNSTYQHKNSEDKWEDDDDIWDIVVLHKNFDNALNGKVEKADFHDIVKIRPIRKF